MARIEKLTPEQEARMPEIRDKWIEIGLNTERANKPEAEEGIRKALKAAGYDQDEVEFIWVTSPLEGAKKVRDLCEGYAFPVYGPFEAGWLAFYDFFGEVCGLKDVVAPLDGLMQAAQNAGLWWPILDEDTNEIQVVVTDRPTAIHLDDQNRLHCTDGPALAYEDGFGIYIVNGVEVPQDIVEDRSSITTDRILNERNAEVRRIMMELKGEENFIKEIGGDPFQEDDFGKLWRVGMGEDEPLVMCEVVCPSTGRKYFLRVPPNIMTCQAGLAWSGGFEVADDYQPLVET